MSPFAFRAPHVRRPLGVTALAVALVAPTSLAYATTAAAAASSTVSTGAIPSRASASPTATSSLLASLRVAPAAVQRTSTKGRGKNPLRADLQRALTAMTAHDAQGTGPVGVTAQVIGPRGTFDLEGGKADLATGQRARHKDVSRVASMSKAMISVLALQQVQSGRWTLDTTVGDVLPGLLPGHDRVTLRQLLSHTSGAPDYLFYLLADVQTEPQYLSVLSPRRTDGELVSYANKLPWMFTPGTNFSYSNTNYVVVGMMLEKATGSSLSRLLERHVFKPARMYDTDFDMDPGLPRRSLQEYAFWGRGPLSLASYDPTLLSAAGAVTSNPRDLNRFYRALLTGKLLRPDLVTTMATPQSNNAYHYGLGVYLVPDPCPAPGAPTYLVGHDGASFGTLTIGFSTVDAKRQIAMSYTGRDYTGAAHPATTAAINALLLATCAKAPTPQSTTSLRASGKRSTAMLSPATAIQRAAVDARASQPAMSSRR